jgi:hypothetical protein
MLFLFLFLLLYIYIYMCVCVCVCVCVSIWMSGPKLLNTFLYQYGNFRDTES